MESENQISNLLEDLILDDNNIFQEKVNKRLNKQDLEMKKLRKENSILKSRVNNLELFMQNLLFQLDLKNKINKDLFIGSNDEIEESWLYWIKCGKSKNDLLKLLKIEETDNENKNSEKEILKEKENKVFFEEMDSNEYCLDEKKMLTEILKKIQNFKNFSDDWKTMDLEKLNIYLGNILNSLMVNDTVIILKKIPGKNHKNYEKILSNIATLAGIMYYSWEEINSLNEDYSGKMALILESDEELQILNVHKKNSRLILNIEPLEK
jgi:hypothetical protein